MNNFNALLLLLTVTFAAAFHSTQFLKTHRHGALTMVADLPQHMELATSFLTAVEQAAKDPNYVYGAVAAPDWVLPLGGVLAILTAAVPILLKPGEEALEQQRRDEEETRSGFGYGEQSSKKRKDRL